MMFQLCCALLLFSRPLFEGDNEFCLCLKESFPNLKTRKLTRVEWGTIRRLMGKPRRYVATFKTRASAHHFYSLFVKHFTVWEIVFCPVDSPRCSSAFFAEERTALRQKRQKMRLLQQRKLSDVSNCKDLPDEIPLPLIIGTKVTGKTAEMNTRHRCESAAWQLWSTAGLSLDSNALQSTPAINFSVW